MESNLDPTANESSEAKPAGGQKHGSLLVIFLTVFVDLLGFGLFIPLLPIYADIFAVDPLGWKLGALMAIFSVMQFVFAPVWGSLSDRIGRRPVLMIGLGGSALSYLLFAYATHAESLILIFISRTAAGITGATISTAQAYIADSTSREGRQRGMALIGMAFGLGFTLGPLLGFLAISDEGIKPSIFPGLAAAGLSLVALILAIFVLPESRHANSDSAAKRLFDWEALRHIRRTPSLIGILLAIFACVFSFAAFETTLSLLIKGTSELLEEGKAPFDFSIRQVCGTFALIGFTLAMIQGGVVRPLAKRLPESIVATSGAVMEVIGFLVITAAVSQQSILLLFSGLLIIVTGFSFMQPSLNSLLSRRSDPEKQGVILGVGQSTNALARILGSGIGIPLLKIWLPFPFIFSAVLMVAGAVLIGVSARSGGDYSAAEEES